MRRKWPWGVIVVAAIASAVGRNATSSNGSPWLLGWIAVSTVVLVVADTMRPKPTDESVGEWRWSRWWVVPAILTILTLVDAVGWSARQQYTDCGTLENLGSLLLGVWLAVMTLFAIGAFIVGIVRIAGRDYSGFIWLLQPTAVVFAWLEAAGKYQCFS